MEADVIAIAETFLDDTIFNSQLLVSNYAIFLKDCNTYGEELNSCAFSMSKSKSVVGPKEHKTIDP